MRYGLAVNLFAESPVDQAVSLAVFLAENLSGAEAGTAVILYDPESEHASILRTISVLLPVNRIYCVAARDYMPETFLAVLAELLADEDCILFPGSYFGDELAVRLAARRNGSSLTGVQSLCAEEGRAFARKKIYAGHVIGTFELTRKPFVAAIEKNKFRADVPERFEEEKEWYYIGVDPAVPIREIEKQPVERDSDLEEARCVVVGGRGMGNSGNVKLLSALAKDISVPFAGSRPCVMNAWLPMNRLIGVSGTGIAPDLCILLGTSGAPALYYGVEKSRRIIAVNTDKDAPVMNKADLAICGDCVEIFRDFVQIVREGHREDESNPADFGQPQNLSDG